jgi:hypothetical protein
VSDYPIPEDLKGLYEMARTDSEPYAASQVTLLIERIARLEHSLANSTAGEIAQGKRMIELDEKLGAATQHWVHPGRQASHWPARLCKEENHE